MAVTLIGDERRDKAFVFRDIGGRCSSDQLTTLFSTAGNCTRAKRRNQLYSHWMRKSRKQLALCARKTGKQHLGGNYYYLTLESPPTPLNCVRLATWSSNGWAMFMANEASVGVTKSNAEATASAVERN
ncbi:hypothetical protein T265_11494 [Opisthorchis viverrini]|uniref:Uncharacterized protein n=1 Tax=Opisthorchis viverrini TaxID=6198 RepID=A0A074YYT7_OPIVI|nr:hypothetical protein T265_11494 [Opisthorchis viverrini]KER19828.1 hypothetical protein T265_11494 [Opisthorchis viverrini]